MKQFAIFGFLFFTFFTTFGQSNLSDYSFVVVPESFEFSSEKDQFQLNSMTKYYLNKNGFNAFFQTELPSVNNCDGLYAEVSSEGSFILTKTVLYLKDCKGNIVFKSEEGTSKKKEYRQAHQESLRDAFKSIEKLKVNQTNLIVDTSTSNVAKAAAIRLNSKNETDNTIATIITTKVNDRQQGGFNDGPLTKFSYYKKELSSYLLRKFEDHFFLYLEDQNSAIGLVLLGELVKLKEGIGFLITGELNGVATFKNNGDIVVNENDVLQVFKFQN